MQFCDKIVKINKELVVAEHKGLTLPRPTRPIREILAPFGFTKPRIKVAGTLDDALLRYREAFDALVDTNHEKRVELTRKKGRVAVTLTREPGYSQDGDFDEPPGAPDVQADPKRSIDIRGKAGITGFDRGITSFLALSERHEQYSGAWGHDIGSTDGLSARFGLVLPKLTILEPFDLSGYEAATEIVTTAGQQAALTVGTKVIEALSR